MSWVKESKALITETRRLSLPKVSLLQLVLKLIIPSQLTGLINKLVKGQRNKRDRVMPERSAVAPTLAAALEHQPSAATLLVAEVDSVASVSSNKLTSNSCIMSTSFITQTKSECAT